MAIQIGDAILNITGDTAGLNKAFAGMRKSALIGIGAIIGVLGKAVKTAADFESAITNAAVVTGFAGEELDIAKGKIAALARELGQNTVFSAREAADAMFDLASKGFKPAELSVRDLQPFLDLAAATQSDLASTTEIVTSTIKAFGLETSEASRVADVFSLANGSSAATLQKLGVSMTFVAPLAKSMNLSLEEVTATLSVLFDRGFDASQAGTALRGVLSKLIKPSTNLTEVLDDLGLTMDDVNPEKRGTVAALTALRKAGLGTANAMKLFGDRAGPAALALVGLGEKGVAVTEAIDKLNTSFNKAGGTAERMAKEQLTSLKNQLKLLKSAWEEVEIEVGEQFIPILKDLILVTKENVKVLGEWIKANPEAAKGIAKTIAKVLALVASLWGVQKVWAILKPAFAFFLGTTVGALITALGSIVFAWNRISSAMKRFNATWSDVWEGMIIQIKKALSWWDKWLGRAVSSVIPKGGGFNIFAPIPPANSGGGDSGIGRLPGDIDPFGGGGATSITVIAQGISTDELVREIDRQISSGRGLAFQGNMI